MCIRCIKWIGIAPKSLQIRALTHVLGACGELSHFRDLPETGGGTDFVCPQSLPGQLSLHPSDREVGELLPHLCKKGENSNLSIG